MEYSMNTPNGLISSDVYYEPSSIGDQAGMLTAFRHAANSIGVEAGVVASHVHPSEIEASVIGDTYYLELISEAELRLKKLSVRYERLRAAAVPALDDYDDAIGAEEYDADPDQAAESQKLANALREELNNDRKFSGERNGN